MTLRAHEGPAAAKVTACRSKGRNRAVPDPAPRPAGDEATTRSAHGVMFNSALTDRKRRTYALVPARRSKKSAWLMTALTVSG
jgi:hypothetical protein